MNFVMKIYFKGALIRGGGAYPGEKCLGKKWPLGGGVEPWCTLLSGLDDIPPV